MCVCVWCVLRRKNKKGENGEKIKNKDIHKSTTIFQIGGMGMEEVRGGKHWLVCSFAVRRMHPSNVLIKQRK